MGEEPELAAFEVRLQALQVGRLAGEPFLDQGHLGSLVLAERLRILEPVAESHRRIDANQRHAVGFQSFQQRGILFGGLLERLEKAMHV